MRYINRIVVPLLLAVSLLACGSKTLPKNAFKLSASTTEQRQLQSRVYEDISEQKILSASVAIIQDLGATITESETKLGLVVGEKMRDATETGQEVLSFFTAVLTGQSMPTDEKQMIKFSLVTTPATKRDNETRWLVRLTIQRIVWNNLNQVSRIEAVNDVEIYQGFFEKLDKSLFLEKHI